MPFAIPDTPLLIVAAFLAGILNTLAGGGSFISFPALMFAGIPAIAANASSTVAIFPAAFAGAYGYRRELKHMSMVPIKALIAISALGGGAGAVLLLVTPQSVFVGLVPWLLLFATLLFMFGKSIGRAARRHLRIGIKTLFIVQLLVAVYGGYFGAGIGFLMLALYDIYGIDDLHAINALKTVLSGCLNGVAVIIFVIKGAVVWPPALLMLVFAVIGGYIGASVGRHIPAPALRAFIAVCGWLLTGYFFFWT